MLSIYKTVLISDKITAYRVEQKNEVVQCHIPDSHFSGILDKVFKERHQRKADNSHNHGYYVIGLSVQLHVGFYLLLITSCDRLIEAKVQRCTDAKLRHI